MLKDNGVAVIEVPYVKDLIDNVEFDTIYHEHLCYFSLTALEHLFTRHGLVVHDVERMPIHGGSLRLFVGKRGESSTRVRKLLDEENGLGRGQPGVLPGLWPARRTIASASLWNCCESSSPTAGGSPSMAHRPRGARCSTTSGIGRDMIDFVVDRNTHKQGRYTPGTHLKIHCARETGRGKARLCAAVELEFRRRDSGAADQLPTGGGRFIIPIPDVKVA